MIDCDLIKGFKATCKLQRPPNFLSKVISVRGHPVVRVIKVISVSFADVEQVIDCREWGNYWTYHGPINPINDLDNIIIRRGLSN